MTNKETTTATKKTKEIGAETTVTASMVAGALGVTDEEKTNPEGVVEMAKKRIYVGPNILGLIAYTVIEDDYPEHIKEFIKECAAIEKMFVPIDKLAEVERKKYKKGTIENRNYKKVESFVQGEVEQ